MMRAIDIETRSLVADAPEYALQPWRINSRKAEISMVAIGRDVPNLIQPQTDPDVWRCSLILGGPKFVGWNILFDCAFLYASGIDITEYTWYDAMLICKWVENSPDPTRSYSLAACAERHLQDWSALPAFLKLKATPEDSSNDKYWAARARLDVVATYKLAQKLLPMLTKQQRRSMTIEAQNIVPNAMALVNGLPTNPKHYSDPIPHIKKEMAMLEQKLGVSNYDSAPECYGGGDWEPSKILRSPKQLGTLLYDTWGLECSVTTEKGAPATSKHALTYLADTCDKAIDILEWRSFNTKLTKFCQSPQKAMEYLGSSVLRPNPKVFGTYTGRYTYASKIREKFPVAMALHQIPRGPEVRRMVQAPDDKILIELDASGQEARLLAEIGDIHSMLDVFAAGRKIHAVMGAAIAGVPYDEFMARYKAGDNAFAGPGGYYYCGKFVNLSMQYRIGKRKQRINARVDYGLEKSMDEIDLWRQRYHAQYPEVKIYWQEAVARAKRIGYAETLAGRRYYLDKWYDEDKWGTESSAINFPIQGSGGDMKNLAITTIYKNYGSDVEFAWDLHDGLFYWLPRDKSSLELAKDMRHTLNNLNYKDAWGWSPRIEFPWDLSIGLNWGDMRELN